MLYYLRKTCNTLLKNKYLLHFLFLIVIRDIDIRRKFILTDPDYAPGALQKQIREGGHQASRDKQEVCMCVCAVKFLADLGWSAVARE